MDARVQTPRDESIGDLFHQFATEGRAVIDAEIGLYKEIARYRMDKAKIGLAAAVAGGLLAFAGLIALLVGFVLGLSPLVGPVAGGLIVMAVTGLIAFALVRYGVDRLAALSGDKQERAALAAGGRKP